MNKSIMAAATVFAALILACGSAFAATFTCTGFSSGGTYQNVTVPAGASCTLDHATISGNVTVGTGASLFVAASTGNTTIGGHIYGNACDFIEIGSTTATTRIVVAGSVTIENCTGVGFDGAQGLDTASPPSVVIGGNVTCDNDQGGCVFDYVVIGGNLACSGNFDCDLQSDVIGNNATINNNTSGGFIANSVVLNNLSCSGNASMTNLGAPNTVIGTRSGQCSGL